MECSPLALVKANLPAGAIYEAQHGEERDDPEGECHVEVIRHGPDECAIPNRCFSHGPCADSVVLGEHKNASSDENSELEHADDTGEVDRADSPSVSPSSDEHGESV